MSESDDHSITRDPIYYVTAGFFALLMTAMPAFLGQPRFLPIIQTLSLTAFVAVALHRRHVRGALTVMAIWLPIQYLVMTLLASAFPTRLESAFTDGFVYRAALTTWFFGGAPHPSALASHPIAYIIELFGIILGSLVTAGVVGVWFLVSLVNRAGYDTGILLASIIDASWAVRVIPYWSLLRAAGYAGLIILCAMPLLTYIASPNYYWRNHRKLILVSVGLVVASFIIQLFLPSIVARPPLT